MKFSIIVIIVAAMLSYQCTSSQNIDFLRLSENKVIINNDTLVRVDNSIYQKSFVSGNIEYKGKIINNKKEGHWISYYENGSICRENNYSNGLRNGKFIWYFKNGIKQQELDLVNGVWHGKDKYWNKDGSLNSITIYENGNKTEIRVYKPNYVNTTDTTTYNGDVIWKKE